MGTMRTFLLSIIIVQFIEAQLLQKILASFEYTNVEIVSEEIQDEDFILDIEVPFKFQPPTNTSEADGKQLKVLKNLKKSI